MIKCGHAFHPIVYLRGRPSHQRKLAAFDLEHVLEPGFHPATNYDVTTNLL
jgi:hypothetical protein